MTIEISRNNTATFFDAVRVGCTSKVTNLAAREWCPLIHKGGVTGALIYAGKPIIVGLIFVIIFVIIFGLIFVIIFGPIFVIIFGPICVIIIVVTISVTTSAVAIESIKVPVLAYIKIPKTSISLILAPPTFLEAMIDSGILAGLRLVNVEALGLQKRCLFLQRTLWPIIV